MARRGRHTEGFTLAELLMSVAIILVLAAIAFPSIVSAQNNMRMLELNNAAQSIANAAQAQMTAQESIGHVGGCREGRRLLSRLLPRRACGLIPFARRNGRCFT